MADFDALGQTGFGNPAFTDPTAPRGTQDYAPNSVYATYVRSQYSQSPVGMDAFTVSANGPGNAQASLVPPFLRVSDPLTLDPDPFGDRTVKWGQQTGQGYKYDHVAGLSVFGRAMSRDQLMQSDAGRRLIDLETKLRRGVRRDFFEAVTDFQWSDLPFVSLFASVGKSVKDAYTVSETFKKLQNGEQVSDDDLIKTRLYMLENEYASNGTWGATVGDIVRAAPGFMAEFAASGGVYSVARTAVAKAAGLAGKGAIHYAMTRAGKDIAKETLELGARKSIQKAGLAAGVDGFKALKANGKLYQKVFDDAVETTYNFLKSKDMNPLLRGADDAVIRMMARNRVAYEAEKMFLRNASDSAIRRGWEKFSQWGTRHISSGLLDHGIWGTEESTVLVSNFTKPRQLLAEAAGALFVQAPIKGTMMWAPNQFIAKPIISSAVGGAVSAGELGLRQSAFMTGDKSLMDDADAISMGMNWLEYVSEGAGPGFSSLGRGVGLWMSRAKNTTLKSLFRPGAKSALAGATTSTAEEGFQIGSTLRKMWTDKFGTRESFLKKSVDDKVRIVGRALREAGDAVDDDVLRRAVSSHNIDVLPAPLKAKFGAAGGVDKFVSKTMSDEYQKQGVKAFARYWVGDWMVRNNIGPETLVNMSQRLGYDGIMGEMLEERYSDVAKGLLGWNDRVDRKEWKTRISEAVKGLYPGFDQLTAEAVGFAFPMVVRMGIARVQSRIGGGGAYDRIRQNLEGYSDIFRSPITVRTKLGEYLKTHEDTMSAADKNIADLTAARDKAVADGKKAAESGNKEEQARKAKEAENLDEQVKFAERTRQRYVETHDRWMKDIGVDKAPEGAVVAEWLKTGKVEGAANELLERLVVIEPLTVSEAESEGTRYTMRPAKAEKQGEEALSSYQNLVDYAPELAKVLAQAGMTEKGESKSWMRTIAHKVVGFAGAVVTGDMSLAQNDPATWIARDMGLGRNFIKTLAGEFLREREAVRKQLLGKQMEGTPETFKENHPFFSTIPQSMWESYGIKWKPGETFTVPEQLIDEVTQAAFAGKARRMMQSYLASQQIRSFSRAEMRDQALAIVAKSKGHDYDIVNADDRTFAKSLPDTSRPAYDETETEDIPFDQAFASLEEETAKASREAKAQLDNEEPPEGLTKEEYIRWNLASRTDEVFERNLVAAGHEVDPKGTPDRRIRIKRKVHHEATLGDFVDESSRIGFDQFYEQNKEEVDRKTSEIAMATLDILSNRMRIPEGDRLGMRTLVSLPDNADFENLAVYDAAMRMAGFSNASATQRLREDRTLEQTLKETAVSDVSSTVMRAVAVQAMNPDGTFDPKKVSRELLETVAYALNLRFDGGLDGATGLEVRDKKIVEICALANRMDLGQGKNAYFVISEDPRIADTRTSDGNRVIVKARLRADGKWECKTDFAGEGEVLVADTADGILEQLKGKAFAASRVDGKVVFTQARVFETSDMATALRVTGLLRKYVERTSPDASDPNDRRTTHPLFRKNEDGQYVYSEERAMEVFEEELALAGEWDGRNLVRPPRADMTKEELEKEAAKAKAMWEKVYGEGGYVTVGNVMLSDSNVVPRNMTGMLSGYAADAPSYQMHINSLMGKDANLYVPIDASYTVDYNDAVLNACFLQAYALNPRLVRKGYGDVVSRYLKQLDNLVLLKIREYQRKKDKPMLDALRAFRRDVTQTVDRTVVNGKGERIVQRGAGLTPSSFSTLASVLCCFRDKRDMVKGYGKVPHVRAILEIADEARMLPDYAGFTSLVDVCLGGDGFFGERIRDGKPVDNSRGLAGLLRTYFNDGDALAAALKGTTPCGMSAERFLEACDRQLASLGKPPIVVKTREEIRQRLEAPRDTVDLMSVYRGYAEAAGIKGEREMRDFVDKALANAVSNLNEETDKDNPNIRIAGLEKELEDKKSEVQKAEEALTQANRDIAELKKRATEATKRLDEANRRLAELKAQAETPTTKTQIAEAEADVAKASETRAKELAEIEKTSLHAATLAGEVRKAVSDLAQKTDEKPVKEEEWVNPEWSEKTVANLTEEDVTAGAADDPSVDWGDVDARVDAEGDTVPDLRPDLSDNGTTVPAVGLTDGDLYVGSNLTWEQGKAGFAITLRVMLAEGLPIDKEEYASSIRKMFPALPTVDMHLLLHVFDDAAANRGRLSWDELASRGISFTYEEDEKEDNEGADTASGDRQFDRNAARELTGKDLQTFLSLARYAAPATGANLQGFLVAMRETVARQVELDPGDESSAFLDSLVNPRRRWTFEGRELKSYNERDAVFHYVLGQAVNDGKVADYLKGQWKKGNTGAFLLSYLSAMDEGSRSRFAQLIANAASCDPAHYQRIEEGNDAGTMDPTDNAGKRTNLAAVAGSLAGLVGKKHSTVLKNARSLRNQIESADERDLERLGGRVVELKRVPGPKEPLSVHEALDAIDHNRFIVADMIAKALESQENPICDVLRSDTLMSYLRRIGGNKGSVARELDVQNICDLARALSVQSAYRADRGTHLSVAFAAHVADAMEIVGANKILHEITLEDTETAALATFTSGSSASDYGALASKSLRFSGPLLLAFNYYTESLPHTVMNKEIDRYRMGDPGSIAITSRGVIPILARWMDDTNGFRRIVDEVFAAEVRRAQDKAEREFAERYRKETAADGSPNGAAPSAEEILQVRDGAREELLGECRQEMVWPDGTRILAKNITEGFDAEEVYDACRRSYTKMRQGGTFFVPVYAGDHSSSVLLQVPYRVGERVKRGEQFSEREMDELGLGEIQRDARAKDAAWKDPRVKGDARKAAKKVADEARKKYVKAKAEFERKYGDKFKSVADAISESIGLGLLGDDTKRSAISSLEQAGLSMIGVKTVDVPANAETGEPARKEVKFGHCHQHVFFNYKSRKTAQEGDRKSLGNEELKGTTLIAGYGAERQRECAKLRGTGTIKVHLISTAGRALSFIKSLCVTPKKQFGEFVAGDCKKVYFEKMQKGIDPEIDTAVGTDLDSLKIGDLTSKWLKVKGTGKSILEHIVDELDRKYDLGNGGKLPENLDLDEEFAGIEFDESREGVAPATRLSDVLPGIRVSMVEGVDGATVDIEYLDDGMTSYNVANVSHWSTATTGRAARNYEVDALTMAAAQIQEGGSLNLASQTDVFSILQDWGLMASTVYGSREVISSLIRTSSGLRDLSVRGESPDGAAMKEELFRTTWARKRENLNVPVYGIDAPLVSAGAGASLVKDADGNVLYDEKGRPRISLLSKSEMLRDLNYGSIVFTDEERKWYRTSRRLGLCAINTQDLSFRYGWWLDQKAFDEAFLKGVENPTNRDRAEALERAIVEIHDAEREAGKQRLDLRKALMSAFVDYHGLHLDEYAPHVAAVSFEDLFIADPSSGDGGRMFDRSAIQWDEQDLVHNDATGEAHVFLGGSAMWLPRTPSYNGSNWAQVVRASIPVTEVKRQVRGKDGMVERYSAGRDAMVSPDPLTNEILGSDHDGDKAKVAFLQSAGTTGQVLFDEIPPAFEGLTGSELAMALDDFVKNGETRQKYLDLLRAKNVITEKVDPATGETILGISEIYRSMTSNRFVRAIMDMARQLPCPEAGDRRVSFLGGPASQATNTFPGSANEKGKLLDKKYDNPNAKKVIQKGHRLSESELAARVTAYANNANDARARAVSLAKSLHLAWASGFYNYGRRDLFHNLKSQDWYRFIHLIDGLSNATFDDIKEQLCMRLGWTKGMLSAFVTDLMLGYDKTTGTYARKLPTTQAEVDPLIEQYVDSVNGYGSRYYMMLTSADNDPHGIKGKAIRQIVFGESYNNWADFFGVKAYETEYGIEYFTGLDLTKQPDRERLGDFVARLASEVVKSDWAKEHGLDMSVSDALRSLAYGVRKGNNRNNPVPGYLFYLCKEVADAKDVAPEDAEGIARRIATTWVDKSKMTKERRDALLVEVGQFLKWSQANVLLESAREFGNAFNYVAADPGSPHAANAERKVIEAGERLMKDLGNDPTGQVTPLLKKGLNFLEFFMKMHAVTRAAYASEYGLEPVSKAAKKWADDTPSLEFPAGRYGSLQDWVRTLASDHAGNENLARMAIGTYALDHLGDVSSGREVDEFGAEVSAQTRPFVIAALQTIGDRSPTENLAMLQRLADAERIASGGINAPHTPGDDIFHLLRAIETLFEVGKRLCSTSTEYYGKRAETSAPYGYFFQRKETRFDKDAYPAAQGRYVIQAAFAGGTEVLVNEANRVIKRVRDGQALSGERVRAGFRLAGPVGWMKNKEKNADIRTKAKSFDLSDANLERFLEEITSIAKVKTEGKVWMRDIRLAQGIVREFGTVTQKQLFDELIPFYIALTTRTVGAPSVQGASLLNLYRDVYAKWSDRQAKNQRIDPDLYNYSIATNFAPINQNIKFSKKRTDGARMLSSAESEVRALDEVPRGDVQEWRDEIWHARRAESLGGDTPTSRTGDVVIPRENPAGRYLTDVFAGDGMLARLATYFQNPVAGAVSKESFGADLARRVKEGPSITEAWIDEKDVDPYARKLAYAMRALVGSWATVKFTGAKTFVIQGNLRSNVFAYSPNAARAIITVDVSDGATVTSEEEVVALSSSPTYAASFVAVKGKALGVETVEDFMKLPFEARCELVRKYGIGAATLNKPSWTIDKRGMAVLCGAMRLGKSKAETQVYHEYFHAMVSMFNQLGVFSEEDVKAFQSAFGEPPAGTDMLFDEEAAAERFRKFVEGKTEKNAKVRSVFARLFDFIKKLYATLANGFRYSKMDGEAVESTLFSLVLGGVAARSTDSLESLGKRAYDVAGASDIALRLGGSVKNSALVRDLKTGATRNATQEDIDQIRYDEEHKVPSRKRFIRYLSVKEAREHAVNHLNEALGRSLEDRGYVGELVDAQQSTVENAAKLAESNAKGLELVELLKREDIDESRVAQAIEEILGLRRTLDEDPEVHNDNTAISLANIPENLVEQTRFAVGLGTSPIGAKTTPAGAAGRAVAEGIEAGLREKGAWSDRLGDIERHYAASPVRPMKPIDKQVVLSGIRDAIRVINPSDANALKSAEVMDNIAFTAMLRVYQGLESSFARQDKDGSSEQYLHRMVAEAAGRAALKAHASCYDVSAWILATGGVTIDSQIEDALGQMQGLMDKCGDRGKNVIRHYAECLQEIDRLLGNPTALVDYLSRDSKEVLDDILPKMTAGLKYLGRDADGSIRDYELVDKGETDNPNSDANLERLTGIVDHPETSDYLPVQEAIKIAVGTAFRAAAQAKFQRELGVMPAADEDIAFENQMQGQFAKRMSAEEWCADSAIGNSNLLDNRGLVDYYDQPYFIADNMNQWLASQLIPSFGGAELRDTLTADANEFAGLKHEISDLENYMAFLLGDNAEPKSNLLAVLTRPGDFEMEAGVVRHKVGGNRYLGFDNYNRKTCGVSLTEDELRTVDFFKKMLSAYMRGQSRILTSVNRIKFYEGEAKRILDGDLGQDAVRNSFLQSRAHDRKLTRFELTLFRMLHSFHSDYLDTGDGKLGLYDRLVDSARAAVKSAQDELAELREAQSLGTLTKKQKERLDEFDFNDVVLSRLERDGLVLCRRDAQGRATEAVLTLGVDEVNSHFLASSAYAKLSSAERWAGAEGYEGNTGKAAREKALSREELVKPFRDVYGRLARFARNHPWLTQGDAKYFTAFDTPLPFFQGSGVFMYNAVRASRDAKVTAQDRLLKNEETYMWACTDPSAQTRLSDTSAENLPRVLHALDILHDVAGLGSLRGLKLKEAIEKGELAFGGKHEDFIRRTGIELGPDATVADVSEAIYKVLVDRAWREAVGSPTAPEGVKSAKEMVAIFEQANGASGITGGLGLTDETMYRNHGVLPANFQLGHLVHVAADQITNALMYRNTFMTMMLTPSADGAPVYYMRPDDNAAELSGIPDNCWSAIARWWAQFHGLTYDERRTGVQNAQALYDTLTQKGMVTQKGRKHWRLVAGDSDHRYISLNDSDSDLMSVRGILCQEDEELGGESSALNALAKGEAVGYMKHFAQSSRTVGFGGPMARALIHHALSWSKSLSVSCSFFFPLATRYESPIGAVGMIPTLAGNLGGADLVRKNPELFNAVQRLFGGSGWVTKDFLGVNDVIKMMDTRDPFYAEMVSWAHALGITISDTLFNPMEPTKAYVAEDIKRLRGAVDRLVCKEAGRRFGQVMDALFTRSGERAFTYVLNATKLATISQIVMKLRHEAAKSGKAFDPIRDLRKYSGYINAEIGGIDPRRYAWEHPWFRSLMNCLFFSWEWTRGAWEAGGGHVLEDLVFGGHSITREERKYIIGRWIRMYGEVMIGIPALMQLLIKGVAKLAGQDDDDDKWLTMQNEDKASWCAFNLTPLMKLVHSHEDTLGWVGRGLGAVVGGLKGRGMFGIPGALVGAGMGLAFGKSALPNYTGGDEANQTTRRRKYYMHFGKQGWEFFRWFDNTWGQLFSKLSMPTQRILEGIFGRNLSYMDRELPFSDMGNAERWLNPTTDGALFNFAKAFLPFTATSLMTFGDAGMLPMFGPIQMGASQTAIQNKLESAVEAWANNDRHGYAWSQLRTGKRARVLAPHFQDILKDARLNGFDPEEQLNTALGQAITKQYSRLFRALPKDPSEPFDAREVERCCRALLRLGAKKQQVMQSVKNKLENQGRDWKKVLTPEQRAFISSVIDTGLRNPFNGLRETAPERIDY